MDPITPPPNAKAILPGFANGTYVEFPFAGHGPSRSVKCAGDMLNKFYDDPTAEPDLSCVEEMEEPQIYAPLYTSSVVPRLAVLAAEDKKKLGNPRRLGRRLRAGGDHRVRGADVRPAGAPVRRPRGQQGGHMPGSSRGWPPPHPWPRWRRWARPSR